MKMTLIIRFNYLHNNMSFSDGTVMYSKKLNGPLYNNLQVGTNVKIIGSGKKLSGIHLYSGVLSSIPVILNEPDEKHRFLIPFSYDNIRVYKFTIDITESPNIDIKHTLEWRNIKSVVYPRIIL
jgi:hypothetical protein